MPELTLVPLGSVCIAGVVRIPLLVRMNEADVTCKQTLMLRYFLD